MLVSSVAVYILLFVSVSDAQWAGLAGAAGVCCIWLLKRKYYWEIAGIVCLGLASVALIWSRSISLAILRRLELGYDTLMMWLDYPLFGVGLGGFNYAYPSYQMKHPI